MKPSFLIKSAGIGLIYFVLFWLVFSLLQHPSFYNRFFAKVMPTYDVVDNQIVSATKPFTTTNEKQYVETMDAFHYACIKNESYNYDPNDEISRSRFAFFPLFPFMWKTTMLSGKEISVLNFILYITAIIILSFTFCSNNKILAILCALSMPTLTVFFIPYSEGLFLFTISLALWGWKKNNNKLYVAGLFLAAMTRPVFILLIGACMATELFLWLCNTKRKIDFKRIILTCSPIILGVFLVAYIQRLYHLGSWITFIHAQKHWGTFLQLPKTIVDWSTEGYGMNVWAMGFCFVFGSIALSAKLFKHSKETNEQDVNNYWYYYSWIYLIAAVLFVLFLQGGCLHSLYRYTLCTPFFYVVLFHHIHTFADVPFIKQLVVFTLFIFSTLIFLELSPYDCTWDFTKTGFVLLTINLLFLLGVQKLTKAQTYIGIALLTLGSVVWNCYLLNMFLAKAWIFL